MLRVSPGGNTPQDTNCTATCLLSRKLFKLDEPGMQDTAGEAGTNSQEMYSYGPPHMAVQKQDDQHEHTFSSYVRIRDVVLKTCLGRWTIRRSGERGSWISVLPARHDDDDDTNDWVQYEDWNVFKINKDEIDENDMWIYIYIYIRSAFNERNSAQYEYLINIKSICFRLLFEHERFINLHFCA